MPNFSALDLCIFKRSMNAWKQVASTSDRTTHTKLPKTPPQLAQPYGLHTSNRLHSEINQAPSAAPKQAWTRPIRTIKWNSTSQATPAQQAWQYADNHVTKKLISMSQHLSEILQALQTDKGSFRTWGGSMSATSQESPISRFLSQRNQFSRVLAWKNQHARLLRAMTARQQQQQQQQQQQKTLASGKETHGRLYSPAAGVRLRLWKTVPNLGAADPFSSRMASTLDLLKVCVNKELVLIHMLFPWKNWKHEIKDNLVHKTHITLHLESLLRFTRAWGFWTEMLQFCYEKLAAALEKVVSCRLTWSASPVYDPGSTFINAHWSRRYPFLL